MIRTIFSSMCLLCSLLLYGQEEVLDLEGTQAPAFELVDIEGNVISSDDTEGKVVVLNFWFIGCKPCLKEIPELNMVHNTYKDKPDVVFASISLDELEKVQKKLKKYNIEYPVVADGRSASELFGVFAYPTNMVIDKQGNYQLSLPGGFPGVGRMISGAIQKALE